MEELKLNVKISSGRFNKLDKLYRDFITISLNKFDEESITRWEVYNAIISELVELGEYKLFEEIQYRFTDGENPNLVMMDIVNKLSDESYLIWLLKANIESFIEEDFKKELT